MAALCLAHRPVPRGELRARSRGDVRIVELIEPSQPTPEPPNRLRVTPETFRDPRLLQTELRVVHGLVGTHPARGAVGVARQVVDADLVAHVAQRLRDDRHLHRIDVGDAAGRRQRAFEELGSLDVGVVGASPVGRDARVPPCVCVPITVEEVEGQQRGMLFETLGRCFQDLGDSLMQCATGAVGKPLVRNVAEQRIPEAQPAGTISDEQTVERRGRRLTVRVENRREQGLVEGVAQHGRMTQAAARLGWKPVDLGRHERVDRVGQAAHPARGGGLPSKLREKSRVASRALDQQRDFVGAKGLSLGRASHELGRIGVSQRLEREHPRLGARGVEAAFVVVTRETHEPGAAADSGLDVTQDVRRSFVHPVRVLDHDEGRSAQHRGNECRTGLLDPPLAEPALERDGLGCVRHVDLQRCREQRQPIQQFGRVVRYPISQPLFDGRGRRVVRDPHDLLQNFAERPVWVRRLIGNARDAHELQIGCLASHLVHQSRLADPGFATQLDDRARTGPGGRDRPAQQLELVVPSDESKGHVLAAGNRSKPADGVRLYRPSFAFDHERWERFGREGTARGFEHAGGREDLCGRGGGHEPRGEIHGVAHHGVRTAKAGTDLAGENVSVIHADAHGQRAIVFDDATQRPQHALFVLAGRPRYTRRKDDLPAIAIDVGAEKGHVVLLRRGLRGDDQLVQRVCQRGRTGAFDELVHPVEVHERNRRDAVFRIVATREQMIPQTHGYTDRQARARRVDEPRILLPRRAWRVP